VADVISVRVKLLVAAGKWQNSVRTLAAVVFSVMVDVIPVLLLQSKYLELLRVISVGKTRSSNKLHHIYCKFWARNSI
jgi:hypothetical protein